MAQYQMAIGIYLQMGKGSMAGNASKKVGEMCEAAEDFENAISAYSQSIDFFEMDSRPSAAGSCREKVAMLSAELGKYDVSASAYDALGRESLTTNLGTHKYNELVVDAQFMKQSLPHSLLAVFYMQPHTRDMAVNVRNDFLWRFKDSVTPREFPLVHFSLTDGFSEDTAPASGRERL